MAQRKQTETLIEKDGKKYRQAVKKSALPFWAASGVWILAALLLPMYSIIHFIGIAVVSLIAGLVTAKVLPKETELIEVPFYTGNADLDTMVKKITESIDEIRKARLKIADAKPETAALLQSMEETVGKIRDAVVSEPRDLPVIRRFMNYYLPTTRKLTAKYVFITAQDSDSENITKTAAAIENAFAQIDTAFKHQLDALFADDALDISTDITVLESLLTRDNLK